MFQKILVPLDGSELAERAMVPALALAQEVNGEVICLSVPYLMHVFEDSVTGYGLMLPNDSVAQVRSELTAHHEGLRRKYAHPHVTLHTEIVDGDEASVILDTAVAQQVDLIVMSTHGRSGFTRWLLGSITEKVLQRASCPVLVIRHAEPLTRMLITLDQSETAELALAPGLEVAKRLGTHVTLFNADTSEHFSQRAYAHLEKVERGLGQNFADDHYQRSQAYLSNIARREQTSLGQEIDISFAANGPVANQILEQIEADEANLVVMATHGRTGLSRWIYGSVTEKVLRSVDCAVMIIRPPTETLN